MSKAQNSKLILLLLAFITLATTYSVVVPLGEGPDEPGHIQYVFFLAREGRLPVQRAAPGQSDVPGEGHQPPLAYALMAPLTAWLPRDERRIDQPGNTRFTWTGGDQLNAVAHGSREYWPWHGAVLAWRLARLVSVGLGAATVACTYLAAQALDRRLEIGDWRLSGSQSPISNLRSPMPLLAAGLVAFNPQFLFTSALVTNDALLATLSAIMLVLVVRNVGRRDDETQEGARRLGRGAITYVVAIGIVLGLALLTKQSAFILAPVALLACLRRIPTTKGQRTTDLRVMLSRCTIVLGTAVLLAGWWYLRNWRLYGDALGLGAFRAEFTTQGFDMGSPAAWVGALIQLHASFWARFGWMNIPPPAWVIWLFGTIEILAAIGLAIALVETLKRSNVRTLTWWPLLALPALALAWVVSFAATAGLVAWQGRFLFPALPVIAILLACGLAAWPNKEQRTENKGPNSLVLFFVLSPLFLVALWLPFDAIRPAYMFHTSPEQQALAQLGTPTYGRFGVAGEPGAELRGWQAAGLARAGGAFEVTLMWHALARQNRDWTVFIHLVDAGDQIVAEDNRPPQDGAFPMTQWVGGDWVRDHHTIRLEPGLAPGSYTLRIGLYDAGTGQRAGVRDRNKHLIGDYLDVGSIIVEQGAGS